MELVILQIQAVSIFFIQVAISQIEKFGSSQSIAVYAELHLLMLSSCKRLRKRF